MFALMGAWGCTSGKGVRLRVTSPDGSVPLRMAYVQVTPLNASPVPLPLSLDTIHEVLSARSVTGFTDHQGEFAFSLDPSRPHEIAVSVPPRMGPAAGDSPVWRGVLDRQGRMHTLESVTEPMTGSLRVEVVNGLAAPRTGQGT